MDKSWFALMIGNSRLHWAWFVGDQLQSAWDSEHLVSSGPPSPSILGGTLKTASPKIEGREGEERSREDNLNNSPIVLASVVPAQTTIWQDYPLLQILTLEQILLEHSYPTLGIDRALALWGAGEVYGWPALVIDAGTALTFTGGNAERQLVGGAILPGLSLQVRSLAQKTAALPAITLPETLPTRWANDTQEAIASGIIYTVLAGVMDFIQAWWQEFPGSAVVMTGGDRVLLHQYLQSQHPQLAVQITVDSNLIFWGMRACRAESASA
ncbi:pantothenate kinase [Trichocoleus sp. FACHB-262]|uniref:pantothenate kinase n=1 Tax=Trichocoleus sp. FACHB-262 TaxID=2692869 RepID=UPI001682070F|nr:pantothenate kinase [Trichocoleus sp. FACHB-262]MBD2122434.1 pantothenate kinase [Trichocoleus sp. FACHB-262]